MCGIIPAKSAAYTPFMHMYVWFWPTLHMPCTVYFVLTTVACTIWVASIQPSWPNASGAPLPMLRRLFQFLLRRWPWVEGLPVCCSCWHWVPPCWEHFWVRQCTINCVVQVLWSKQTPFMFFELLRLSLAVENKMTWLCALCLCVCLCMFVCICVCFCVLSMLVRT